jgi:altered-inheritance-of-mitochondria protein 5
MKEVPAGVVEMAKDRWNREIEGLLRGAYETDWNAVRAKWEDRVVGLASSAKNGLNDVGKDK